MREAGALFLRRCGAVGGRRADRPPSDADRPAGVSRPQSALRPDRHRALYVGPACRWQSAPGAKAAPAAIRRAETQPTICPTFSKAARPTSSASRDSPPVSPGSRNAGRIASPPRGRAAPAGRRLGREAPKAGKSPAAGIGDPRRSPLADRPDALDTPGPGLDPRHQLRDRGSPGTPLCALYPSRPGNLPRRHLASQPRSVHDSRRRRYVCDCAFRDYRGSRLSS